MELVSAASMDIETAPLLLVKSHCQEEYCWLYPRDTVIFQLNPHTVPHPQAIPIFSPLVKIPCFGSTPKSCPQRVAHQRPRTEIRLDQGFTEAPRHGAVC